jgi:hypothetical protein
VVEVRPNPSWDQRMTTTPRPMRARLRVERHLRVVRARLYAQVAAGALGRELIPGERRQVAEHGRPRPRQPEPVVEQRGPQPDGDRQPRRPQAERLARIGRRKQRVRGAGLGRAPRGHAGGGGGPGAQQVAHVVPVGRDHIEGGEVQPVLRGRGDPGLVATMESDRIPARCVLRRRRGPDLVPRDPRRREPAGRTGADQGAPREGHQRATIVPPTFESGSASASTAWLSPRRCAGVTVA